MSCAFICYVMPYSGMLLFSSFWFVLVDLVFPYLSVEIACEKLHDASTCLVILLHFAVLLVSVFYLLYFAVHCAQIIFRVGS